MKIYGSLFLWIPLTVFLIWLGIKELPDEVLHYIGSTLLILFAAWNFVVIMMFIFIEDIRYDVKKLAVEEPLDALLWVLLCPILFIPIITYYLNDKFTIKI